MEKVFYFHTPQKKGLNRYTVAGQFSDDNQLTMSLAKCSLRDTFCRKTGRDIATGRLESGTGNIEVTITPEATGTEFIENAIQFIKSIDKKWKRAKFTK
jgi:hypothetical protein